MKNFLKNEFEHYRSLPHKARLLILSYNLRAVTSPILALFLNAYIWRMTSSVETAIIYNLGMFFALPIGFFINGKLLKKLPITHTHLIGLFLAMLGVVSVIFFHSFGWLQLFAYGLISGMGGGIYWASRNYLTFQETNSTARNYFFSIASIANSVIKIFVSFLIGWIIAFADISGLYSPTSAYVSVTIFALISVFFAGYILLGMKFDSPVIKTIWQLSISRKWTSVRIANISIGILEGTNSLICTLLVLYFLGKEGVLGTIGAAVSLFSIILYYLYGRLAKQHHRGPVFLVSLLLSLVLGIILFLGGNVPILTYVLLANLPIAFYELTLDTWQLDVMDKELSAHPSEKYALIVDNEVFLNTGRIIGLLLFLALAMGLSDKFALKISPLLLASLQVVLFATIWKKVNWNGN